jgi:hypothetical protein
MFGSLMVLHRVATHCPSKRPFLPLDWLADVHELLLSLLADARKQIRTLSRDLCHAAELLKIYQSMVGRLKGGFKNVKERYEYL